MSALGKVNLAVRNNAFNCLSVVCLGSWSLLLGYSQGLGLGVMLSYQGQVQCQGWVRVKGWGQGYGQGLVLSVTLSNQGQGYGQGWVKVRVRGQVWFSLVWGKGLGIRDQVWIRIWSFGNSQGLGLHVMLSCHGQGLGLGLRLRLGVRVGCEAVI